MTDTMIQPDPTQLQSSPPRSRLKRLLLPAAILIGAVLVGFLLMRTGPKATRTPPPYSAKLVDVETVRLEDRALTIEVMGTVLPAREIALTPRVNGEIVEVSPEFVPGGFPRAGEALVRIDPTDYQLLIQQRESALAQAESAYRLEMGQQSIASRELEMLSETVAAEDRDLVLRKPQLQSAEATVASARAALQDARLDLARTRVKAPFNAVISERFADIGGQVSTATRLATLVGTDTFWVEASVPVDQLRWIDIPRMATEKGAKTSIYSKSAWGATAFRSGAVIRLRPELEQQGRMARLLIAVSDPLAIQPENADKPRMILSTYVRVEIEGTTLQKVATIPRSALRDDDHVYLMDGEGGLEIRPVEIIFRSADQVFARGIRAGEKLVITDLSAPVEGMPLRIQDSAETTAQGGKEGAS